MNISELLMQYWESVTLKMTPHLKRCMDLWLGPSLSIYTVVAGLSRLGPNNSFKPTPYRGVARVPTLR